MSTAEFAEADFAAVSQYYPDYEVALRETFTTTNEIQFERQDVTSTIQGIPVYLAQFVAVVNGKGIEIVVTLADEDEQLLEDVLDSVATVVVH